jgi:hypothetical protein
VNRRKEREEIIERWGGFLQPDDGAADKSKGFVSGQRRLVPGSDEEYEDDEFLLNGDHDE